jgi:ectoine hydroxylase-related dioxygenase (phytanoyl-CoA dioxygenase family)
MSNELHRSLMLHGATVLSWADITPVKYLAGAIIPKFKGEGRRQWHVDWWDWDDVSTRWICGPQYGVIFYLDDTKDCGSFITVPGSHLHVAQDRPENLSFEPHNREFTVDISAGSAIVFDARLMHAVSEFTATRKEVRIAMTMWYLTHWDDLSEGIKATAMLCHGDNSQKLLGDLAPDYTGCEPPRPCVTIPKWG